MLQWEYDRRTYDEQEIMDEGDSCAKMRMRISNLRQNRAIDYEVTELFEKIVDEIEEMKVVTNRPEMRRSTD